MNIFDKIITAFFVIVFGTLWFFSTKYYCKPNQYRIIIYDVFGKETSMDGLRICFQTREVAESFVKEYQKSFPIFQFELASFFPKKYQRRSVKFLANLISHK